MLTFALLRDSSNLHIYKDLYGDCQHLCAGQDGERRGNGAEGAG